MPAPWSREEVEATVADYLHMLTQELAGQSYNKTKHRHALAAKLNHRNDGAIERKHQNISAVLIDLRQQRLAPRVRDTRTIGLRTHPVSIAQ